jgi:hypothetical protein
MCAGVSDHFLSPQNPHLCHCTKIRVEMSTAFGPFRSWFIFTGYESHTTHHTHTHTHTHIFKTNCPIGLKNVFFCRISHLSGGLL